MTIKLKKNPKISWKNSKLKQKTQNSRKKLKVREDFPSPCLPSDVKKKCLAYDYRSEDKAALKFNLIGQYSILTLQKEKSFLWKNKSDCKASQTCCASEVSSMHLQTLNQYKQPSQDAIISGHFLFIPNYPWEENGEVSLQYYNTSHQSVGRGK